MERQLEQRRVEDGQEAHEGQGPTEGCWKTHILPDESAIREANIAQAKDDEVGTCIDTCFKFVVPSSDPVPGHTARGVIDPGPGRRELYDPVPGRQAVQNLNDSIPVQEKASRSDDPVPGRRMVHHVYAQFPGRQILKDDLVPGHLGRRPLIIDDEDDEVELTQHYTGRKWSSDWKTGKQVRVVDDEVDPEPCYVGWMAARNDSMSVDILAHAVAEPVLDDELDMEELVRRARLGRHPEQRHVFQFGKYRNESYEDVTEETPDYYFWGLQERKPSKYLQHYLGWVTEHYDVDSVRSTLTSKATGRILEAKPTPTKGRKQTESQLNKSLRQEGWKQTAKCVPRCDPRHATRAGSNATHVRFTCLQCGTVTQSKREDPVTRPPETCPHENTDVRGSSSSTHRVYCKDCGQYVYECPQSEWRQQQNETRDSLLRGRTERIDFSRGGERVTRTEVSELIHSFPQALTVFPKRCACSCGSVQTKSLIFTRLNKFYKTA